MKTSNKGLAAGFQHNSVPERPLKFARSLLDRLKNGLTFTAINTHCPLLLMEPIYQYFSLDKRATYIHLSTSFIKANTTHSILKYT